MCRWPHEHKHASHKELPCRRAGGAWAPAAVLDRDAVAVLPCSNQDQTGKGVQLSSKANGRKRAFRRNSAELAVSLYQAPSPFAFLLSPSTLSANPRWLYASTLVSQSRCQRLQTEAEQQQTPPCPPHAQMTSKFGKQAACQGWGPRTADPRVGAHAASSPAPGRPHMWTWIGRAPPPLPGGRLAHPPLQLPAPALAARPEPIRAVRLLGLPHSRAHPSDT